MKITGIILAGGKSSRMGKDKGLLTLNGKPMVQHVIDALKPITSEIIIISNNRTYKKFGFPVYEDIIKEKGPVGGIYTGLYHSQTEINFCISCDAPFVSSDFIEWLIEKSEDNTITLPMHREKIHQMIGLYPRTVLPIFKSSTENNLLKLGNVNREIGCRIINIEEEYANFNESIFSNINTRLELKNSTNES